MSAVEVRFHNGSAEIVNVAAGSITTTMSRVDSALRQGCLPCKDMNGRWMSIPSTSIKLVTEYRSAPRPDDDGKP